MDVVNQLKRAIADKDFARAEKYASLLRANTKLRQIDRVMLAKYALLTNDIAEAIGKCRTCLEDNADYAAALLVLVDALKVQGNLGEAAIHLRRVCEIGSSLGYRIRLAELLLLDGRVDEACEVGLKVLELEAKGRFKSWFSGHFPAPMLVSRLANAEDAQKVRLLVSLLDLSDSGILRSVELALRQLAIEGDRRVLCLGQALSDVASGTALAANVGQTLRRTAGSLVRHRHWQMAADVVEYVLILEPQSRDGLMLRAVVCAKLGQASEARASLVELLMLFPTDVRAATLLATESDVDQLTTIADRIAPLVFERVRKAPSVRADAVRVLTRLMRYGQAHELVANSSLQWQHDAEAAFELATMTFDTTLAERAIRECLWKPGAEVLRNVWELETALMQADLERTNKTYERFVTEGDLALLAPALQDPATAAVGRYAAMALGRYEEAFASNRVSKRRDEIANVLPNLYRFDEPLESLSTANVLVIGYTALGDEVRMVELVERFRLLVGSCTLAVDKRLVDLVARKSEGLTVVGVDKQLSIPVSSTLPVVLRGQVDDMLWAMMPTFDRIFLIRDLETLLVQTVDDLPHRAQVLASSDALRLDWRRKLEQICTGPRVGIFWRSGVVNYRRLNRVTNLADWKEVFDIPVGGFVSLQYGANTSAEIAALAPQIEIHELTGLDSKNDLPSLAAVMCELDAVVAVSGSTQHLAGALGVRTIAVTHPSQFLWRTRPGTNIGLWSPCVEVVTGPASRGFEGAMVATADRLRDILSSRGALPQ